MRILALDLGKYKSAACNYEAETGGHRFTTIPTNPRTLHDLIVDRHDDWPRQIEKEAKIVNRQNVPPAAVRS